MLFSPSCVSIFNRRLKFLYAVDFSYFLVNCNCFSSIKFQTAIFSYVLFGLFYILCISGFSFFVSHEMFFKLNITKRVWFCCGWLYLAYINIVFLQGIKNNDNTTFYASTIIIFFFQLSYSQIGFAVLCIGHFLLIYSALQK